MGFIFVKTGSDLGVFDPFWYFSLILMSLATTIMAPLLLRPFLVKKEGGGGLEG